MQLGGNVRTERIRGCSIWFGSDLLDEPDAADDESPSQVEHQCHDHHPEVPGGAVAIESRVARHGRVLLNRRDGLAAGWAGTILGQRVRICLLYTSSSPRDA